MIDDGAVDRLAGRESGSLELAALALTARLANLPVNKKKSSSCRRLLLFAYQPYPQHGEFLIW